MDISTEFLLRYTLKFLKISGGYGETGRQKLIFFITLLYTCSGIPQMILVIQAPTIGESIQSFSRPLQFYSTFIKALLYFWNRSKFFELIFAIDYVPAFLASKATQQAIMTKANKRYSTVWKTYSKNVWGGMLCLFVMTLLKKEFFIPVEFGIEMRYDNPMYWMTALFLFISMFHAATIAMTMDLLPAGIYTGIMMRIQVLQSYVKRIGEGEGIKKNKYDHVMIKNAVKEYIKIEGFVNKAARTFSGILLVQIILSFIIISTSLFYMSRTGFMEYPFEFMFSFAFAFNMMLELFIPMTFANDLEFESNCLAYALYSSNWLALSMRNRKEFILLQETTLRPLRVRCFSWLTIDLPTYTKIIQTSYRWYTLMRDINVK